MSISEIYDMYEELQKIKIFMNYNNDPVNFTRVDNMIQKLYSEIETHESHMSEQYNQWQESE